MAIAYAVGAVANLASCWASTSGGAPASFGGLPDSTTDIIVDAASSNFTFNIESLIKSITISANKMITQTTPAHFGAFTQSDGDWDTTGQDIEIDGILTQSGGIFDGSLNTIFLVGALNLSGGSLLGEPSLPTIDTSVDVPPTTSSEALAEAILNPKRMRGDEGEVEMHSLKDMIEADKYLNSKAQSKTGKTQNFFSTIRHTGSTE